MREWGYFLFFASFFCFYFAAGTYVSWRICAGLNIVGAHKYLIFSAAGFMSAVAALAYIFSEYGIDPFAAYLSAAGGVWMGFAGISVSVFVVCDLLNAANLIFKISNFRYYSVLVSLVLVTLLCVWSLINAAFILKVREITMPVSGLKAEKLTITLLADMHIDKQSSYGSVKKIMNAVKEINSDIIVIAGDLLDIDVSETYEKYGLDKLRAPYGVYAVTGNHEYFAGVENYAALCEKLKIKLLRNENAAITTENGETLLYIAGINDRQGTKFNIDSSDIEAAFAGTDKSAPVLFLSHRPEEFDKIKETGTRVIQLSGHTHAGQIPPLEIVRRLMKYNYGLYEHKEAKMYVTSGVRWWRVPMRAFNAAEIALIKLERAPERK